MPTVFSTRVHKLNTDYLNYSNILLDGFPQSSPRTRIFKPIIGNYSKNSIIQYPKGYSTEYIKQKIAQYPSGKYHQQLKTLSLKATKSINSFIYKYSKKNNLNQIPCDVVVCSKTSETQNNVSLVHLHYPNEWSAEEAIGKPFNYFHKAIKKPDGRNIVPDSYKLIDNFIYSGKFYERVGAYSIRCNPLLNLHPTTQRSKLWQKSEKIEDFYLRFERQVVAGLPEIDSFIFLIHTYFVSASAKPALLKSAIINRDPYCYPRDVINRFDKQLIDCCDSYIKL
jgi:hypothetical protein